MKTPKTEKLISEMVDYHGFDMWPDRFKVMAEESDAELTEILKKSEELDCREKGVIAKEHCYPSWFECGKCGAVVDGKYCSICGTKVIYESGGSE